MLLTASGAMRFAVSLLVVLLFATCCQAGLLRGKVVDAQSGAVLPCRMYVQAEDGTWLFAKSSGDAGSAIKYSVERSATSVEKHVTLSADPFEVDIPAGRFTITVELGKEYHTLTRSLTIGEQPMQIELPLSRWIDMNALGWYSGDTHVHRKLEDLPNLMLAEDLNVTFPLTYWVRAAYEPATRGRAAGDVKADLISVAPNRVIWPINTEYELFTVRGKPHTQGAVFVLNQRRGMELAAPPVLPVAREAHRSGALLDLDKHSWNWSTMIVPVMNVDLFELANNHVWRTEFAFRNWTVEMLPATWEIETQPGGFTEWGWIDWGFKTYYAFLNCGFRLRPTGGTAAGVHPVPVGFGRVYVQVPGKFTYDKWIEGLNAGHSFVTTGPMLMVEFNGQSAGAVFKDTREVAITGTAESRSPLDRIEIVVNGDVVRTVKPANKPTKTGGYSSEIAEKLPLETSSWAVVHCFDQPTGKRFRYAHTAPAHYEIDGPVRPKHREVTYFIERMTQEIRRNRNVLAAEDLAEYEQALAIYRKLEATARD